MNFEETVRAMSMKEIIMAMVNGLRNPHVKVVMSSFGHMKDGICFGCAATNTVCEITGKTYDEGVIEYATDRAKFMNCTYIFLHKFESAID